MIKYLSNSTIPEGKKDIIGNHFLEIFIGNTGLQKKIQEID